MTSARIRNDDDGAGMRLQLVADNDVPDRTAIHRPAVLGVVLSDEETAKRSVERGAVRVIRAGRADEETALQLAMLEAERSRQLAALEQIMRTARRRRRPRSDPEQPTLPGL